MAFHFTRLSDGWFAVTGPDLSVLTRVRLGHAEDGRLSCTGVLLGSDGGEFVIGTRDIRTVRLGEIVDAAASNPMVRSAVAAGALPPLRRPERVRPGRKGHGEQFYQQFAENYLALAARSRKSPVVALTARYGVSEAAIYRWVLRARELGLLD